GVSVRPVGDHDDAATRVHEAGGGAVEDAAAGSAAHGVGLEAGAVVEVEHVHLLVLEHVGEIHELRVERDRAHVVEVGARDRGPVDLGLRHRATHQLVLSCSAIGMTPRSVATSAPAICIVTLSIRRASPTWLATATTTSPSMVANGARSDARRTSAYSSSRPWRAASASTTARTRPGSRSPASTAATAARSEAKMPVARRRSSVDR